MKAQRHSYSILIEVAENFIICLSVSMHTCVYMHVCVCVQVCVNEYLLLFKIQIYFLLLVHFYSGFPLKILCHFILHYPNVFQSIPFKILTNAFGKPL